MSIVGHKTVRKNLTDILSAKNIAQSYIFCGPAHVGKHTIAQQFAHALVNGNTQLSDVATAHADIIAVAPRIVHDKKNRAKVKDIGVEEVRTAITQLSQSPLVGKRRVLVIDDADRMTTRAQNALLKTLEEPPSNSVIILVTAYCGRILSTILSRVRHVNFASVSLEDMQQFARQYFSDDTNRAIAQRVAMGKPGLLYQYAHDEQQFSQARSDLAQYERLSTMTIYDKIDYAHQLSQHGAHAERVVRLWIALWHDDLCRQDNSAQQSRCTRNITYSMDTLALLETSNVNVRLTLEDWLFHLE